MICKINCLSCPYEECERDKRQKETYRRYYQKNRERRLAYQRAYNKAHKEQRAEYNKKWWANRKRSKNNGTYD